MPKRGKILVTGACGGLATEFAREVTGDFELVGIDPRPERPHAKFLGELHQSHYRSRKVDEIFRRHRFHALFHLGRIPVTSGMSQSDRYSENVLGTQHLLDLAKNYDIKTVVVLSTYHVYGAHPLNPLYLCEGAPLRATQTILELADAMELDHLASQFALSFSGNTVLLRPTNVVGNRIQNVLSTLLRNSWLPVPLGFDPPLQLLNQDDLIAALCSILENPKRGIFNLAGPDAAPLSKIMEIRGIKPIPVPDFLLKSVLSNIPAGTLSVPAYMVNFLKYPALIDSSAFSRTYDFQYKHGFIDSLSDL